MEKGWLGLPYKTIADHFNSIFGTKVYKIPVSVVDSCPNREGLRGMQTCVFCDPWGSAARAESLEMDLRSQIETFREGIAKRSRAKDYLIYFQAYTNTFTKISAMRENFQIALSYPDVKGIVVGTRPDCISPALIQLWREYSAKSKLFIELGVQSFSEDELLFLRRGHTAQKSLEVIHKLGPEFDLGIHLIFGNPGESMDSVIATAKLVNELPITNVKLHHLHVLKSTPLEEMFYRNEYVPLEFQEYCQRVEAFLQHLHPRIAVQRLAAFSSRWDELVAPEWTKDKMGTHQKMIDYLRKNKSYQSQKLDLQILTDQHLQKGLLKKALSSDSTYGA